MSHPGMTLETADKYQTNVIAKQLQNGEEWGYFSHYDPFNGITVAKRCVIVGSDADEYYVRYFDEKYQAYTYAYVEKSSVTVESEVKELAFWVVKNKNSGKYHSSTHSASTAPQLYLTKGKAESRRKQKSMPDQWVVMKWVISERES